MCLVFVRKKNFFSSRHHLRPYLQEMYNIKQNTSCVINKKFVFFGVMKETFMFLSIMWLEK